MVILPNRTFSFLIIGLTLALSMLTNHAEACQPSDLIGRVRSVIVSEASVDRPTGKVIGVREVLRINISQDGNIAITTLAPSGSARGPQETSTTYFENGRPVRAVRTVDGKTAPSMTCSYDPQGRLLEAKTGSGFTEFATVETYEYGPNFVRRNTAVTPGGAPTLTTQTIDASGRVIKEVVVNTASSAVQRIKELTYDGNRKEECEISPPDTRRLCATTVIDAHGNEIEFVTLGRTRKTVFEYDSTGNWISKRTAVTGPGGTIERIVQRKIEYW